MFGFHQRIKESAIWHAGLVVIIATALGALVLSVPPVSTQEMKQKVFGSPEEALKALAETVNAGDTKGMMAILGPEGEDIISSGDAVADKEAREGFIKAYREKIDVVKERGDRVSVILGNDNWPFPIPIVKRGEGWVFDTKVGREEVLNRRVGRNELNAIKVCLAYVDAQREYASTDRERDGIIQYAQRIVSDPNTRNGLYWQVVDGEIPSPLGPFAASAAAEGYRRAADKPTPYHGYYYKILKGQGKSAPGGAYSYVINGHMVAGFALVAWPAEHDVSGVMTFIVNQNGKVYQKDLGPKTEAIVKTMTIYNPDRTWKRAH
jgi:hypothetical protein